MGLWGLVGQATPGTDKVTPELGVFAANMGTITGYVRLAVTIAMAVVALLAIIFAIYLGVKLAKAEDDGKRKEAKNQMIYALIGAAGVVVIAGLLNLTGGFLVTAQGIRAGEILTAQKATSTPATSGLSDMGLMVITIVNQAVLLIVALLQMVAVAFAMYLGWKLMSAEDDSKRKQAKQQLIYTLIALVIVIIIPIIVGGVVTILTTQVAG